MSPLLIQSFIIQFLASAIIPPTAYAFLVAIFPLFSHLSKIQPSASHTNPATICVSLLHIMSALFIQCMNSLSYASLIIAEQ